jgi:hypothetical protein
MPVWAEASEDAGHPAASRHGVAPPAPLLW